MKKIALLNLYLAVLENGGPSASLRREPLGVPDSRPVMKGTSLLNLYLAVLENGVPSASLRCEPMGAQGFPVLSLWSIATVLGEDHGYGVTSGPST